MVLSKNLKNQIKNCFKNKVFCPTSEMLDSNIHPRDIRKATDSGLLIKIKRGLYMLVDNYKGYQTDLAAVTAANKNTVICLTSALQYYELTTYVSNRITVGIPNNLSTLKINYPLVKFYYFSKKTHYYGVEEIKTDSGIIRIYDKERSLCDIFRFRNEFGEDIAIESLRNYIKSKESNTSKLLEYATVLRIKNVMMPYLLALMISEME